MEDEGFTSNLRRVLFAGLTGQPGDVTGRGSVTDMLRARYGDNRRGGVDTRAAARGMGVSQRTVQRWISGSSRPSPAHLKGIKERARRVASTPTGRRRALAAARKSFATRYGANLRITGRQGPNDPDRKYRRPRMLSLNLDPDQVGAMLNAYEQQGDRGIVGWLEQHADENYVSDWVFEDITDIGMGASSGDGSGTTSRNVRPD